MYEAEISSLHVTMAIAIEIEVGTAAATVTRLPQRRSTQRQSGVIICEPRTCDSGGGAEMTSASGAAIARAAIARAATATPASKSRV